MPETLKHVKFQKQTSVSPCTPTGYTNTTAVKIHTQTMATFKINTYSNHGNIYIIYSLPLLFLVSDPTDGVNEYLRSPTAGNVALRLAEGGAELCFGALVGTFCTVDTTCIDMRLLELELS